MRRLVPGVGGRLASGLVHIGPDCSGLFRIGPEDGSCDMQLYLSWRISNISMQQQKRLNLAQQGKGAEHRQIKLPTRKHNKVKQIKSKIFKNISQLPIEINLDSKENHPLNHPHHRPQSSLLHEHPHPKPHRLDSALSQYPDHRQSNNRKRLSLDSTGKKYERDSLISKNSMSKKMSRNTKSIEESLKLKFAEQRRKSNVSCRSIHEQGKVGKKPSLKVKRPSVSSLHQGVGKEKENREPKQGKLPEKSRSKSKKVKRKSTAQLDKSKASTTVIANFDKAHIKKKQSNSTNYFGLTALPRKKKKVHKKKSEKHIDLTNPLDEPSMEEYPISKYDVWAKPRPNDPRHQDPRSHDLRQHDLRTYDPRAHDPRAHEPKRLSSKRRSKSGKGSASKQRKKGASMLQIDYVSCINIPSNSSGLIESKQSNSSSQRNSKIKILDNWEYNYLGDNTQSVNLEEIRYYESNHAPHPARQQDEFMRRNFRDNAKYHLRSFIEAEIADDYPHFEEVELKFLASVVFIQRKWRENRLYRQIFEQIAHSPHKLSQLSLEKSNSKQLNITNNHKSPEKQRPQPSNKQHPQPPNKQHPQPAIKQHSQQLLMQSMRQSGSSQSIQQQLETSKAKEASLKNNIYLQELHSDEEERQGFSGMKEELAGDGSGEGLRSDENNLTARSEKYEFLGNQLFPSMAYLRVKEEQLKQQLYQKLCHLSELQRDGTIDGKEYQKLRLTSEEHYKRELDSLNKSRKDIKKGYLSFIDTCKSIKQANGLRRVSSDHGPMALLYMRIFNLQSSIKTPSDSSESLKKLTKRVLIRREFFNTHKIEASHATLQTLSARHATHPHAHPSNQTSLSARMLKRREPQHQPELAQSNEMQELQIKRIREGFILSPDIKVRAPHNEPLQKPPQLDTNVTSSEQKQSLVLEEIIATLTHELFCELMKIDERRENVVDILQEGQNTNLTRIKGSEVKDFEIVEESSSLDFEEEPHEQDFQIVEESKLRQIYKIEGLGEKTSPEQGRKHRKSNTYNISPASLEPVQFEDDEILTYGRELFDFLKHIRIEHELLQKLNKNQGFSPAEYLRFLRDFEIPDEEYEPLVSNQVFMQWEEHYDTRNTHKPQEDGYLKRQASAVFHRCIFECLIGFLEQFRPCGEKGEPFPWEQAVQFSRPLGKDCMGSLYGQSLAKLEHTIKLKCGIIEEKQVIFSQLDMERVHEENEDKIIFMLEEELALSPHAWYEIEEHTLEVKLELEAELFQYIMLEALDELLQLF